MKARPQRAGRHTFSARSSFLTIRGKHALHRICGLSLAGFGFLAICAVAPGQRSIQTTDRPISTGAAERELGQRREPPSEAVSVEGLIRLDITVTDQAGKAVAGLQRTDFRLFDNGQPQRNIAFRASKGLSASTGNSLAVIILLDTLDLSPDLAAFERQQVTEFLRSNSGQLKQPVTIYSLEDSGFFLTAKSSTDRETLATDVASDNKVAAYFLAPHAHSPLTAVVEPLFYNVPALTGLRALWTIATTEASRPGRKLLFWIGPGLGFRGTGAFASDGTDLLPRFAGSLFGYSTSGKKGEEVKRTLFQKICWFSLLLRQARVTLDCFSISKDEPAADTWSRFLTVVPSAQEASWMNLFKNVLAVKSGGRVLPSSNGLIGPMNDSIENARIFYSFTFEPPVAAQVDEYHSLKVELSQPTLTADTSAGYYDQPFYSDPPGPRIHRVTVSQLEQILQAIHGGASAARRLSGIVLTERISQLKLRTFLAMLHDKKLRELLELIAVESTFLDPPSSKISPDPPPDQAEQQRMLKAAADYLDHAIARLPDFLATRTAVYYREAVSYPGLAATDMSQPLHAEQHIKETVLYRSGKEIVSSASPHIGTEIPRLQTYGTFGPILSVLQFVSKSPGDVTWGWWEKSGKERRAVFSYRLAGAPTVDLRGCCYPNGSEGARVNISAGSHGEFVVDPATGAVLRVQAESDLPGFIPTKQSDMMVSYGPIEIGGKTYVVPLRSVNIFRSRSVATLVQWNLGFATWGPYETEMNVFTFDKYHIFRGSARMLPGFEEVP